MKKIKLAALIATLGCGLSTLALADDGYSSSQSPATTGRYPGSTPNIQSGYGSDNQQSRATQGSTSSQTVFYSSSEQRHHSRHEHRARMRWVRSDAGRIPRNAVAGGYESNGKVLYICQASFHGGVHPGKIVGTSCNIGYGGQEVAVPSYRVLTSSSHYTWANVNGGFIPEGAFPGGYENGHALYICQTSYAGGMHPGKVIENRCNITYAGKEIVTSDYDVLIGR